MIILKLHLLNQLNGRTSVLSSIRPSDSEVLHLDRGLIRSKWIHANVSIRGLVSLSDRTFSRRRRTSHHWRLEAPAGGKGGAASVARRESKAWLWEAAPSFLNCLR